MTNKVSQVNPEWLKPLSDVYRTGEWHRLDAYEVWVKVALRLRMYGVPEETVLDMLSDLFHAASDELVDWYK